MQKLESFPPEWLCIKLGKASSLIIWGITSVFEYSNIVYENMKKSALTVFKHQKMIYENALLSVNPKDEIF